MQGRWWTKFTVNRWATVWDIENRKLVFQWPKPEQGLGTTAFTHDDKEVLFGSRGGYIYILSMEERRVVREWKASPYLISSLKLSNNDRYLASYNSDAAKIWDYSTGKLIHEFKKIAFNVTPA